MSALVAFFQESLIVPARAVTSAISARDVAYAYGRNDIEVCARAQADLARSYELAGDGMQAIEHWKECIALREAARPEHAASVAEGHRELARTYDRLALEKDAVKELETAYRLLSASPEHANGPEMAKICLELAAYLLREGHPRAYRLLETALSIRTSVFGPNSLAVADVHRALGDTFAAHNDMAHAESHFNSALDIYNLRAENVDASEAAKCAESIALCHVAVGDREQALDRIAQAVIRAETDLGAKHPDLLRLQVVECTLRQSC
jgi:tetratricopeptide (TPR) repeat protein